MSGAERISFDVERMFPEAARRVRILEQLKRSWAYVVEAKFARYSCPYNLGVNELWVAASNDKVKAALLQLKGTIARRIAKRFGYVFEKPFTLTVDERIPAPKKPPVKRRPAPEVVVDEEKVRQYMQGAPETLPENINYAISHLRAFMEARFPASS